MGTPSNPTPTTGSPIEEALEKIGEILDERDWGNAVDWDTEVRRVLENLVDRVSPTEIRQSEPPPAKISDPTGQVPAGSSVAPGQPEIDQEDTSEPRGSIPTGPANTYVTVEEADAYMEDVKRSIALIEANRKFAPLSILTPDVATGIFAPEDECS